MKPIERVLRDLGDEHLSAKLAEVSGADFTTLLFDVFKQRPGATTPAAVMQQRMRDRFVAPGEPDLKVLRQAETVLLEALPERFDALVLSPLAPLGLHSAVAGVDQGRVVSTIRRTEVAADSTAGLGLEAAVRRRALLDEDPTTIERVRLATIQRVVRAQVFDSPMSFAHFTLLGLVTAGRDTGSNQFEIEAMAEHATTLSTCLLEVGADHVTVNVTDWTNGDLVEITDVIQCALPEVSTTVLADPARTRAQGYYLQAGFEIHAEFGGKDFNVADGGLVDWTQSLLASRKERLMVSGIGVDRVAFALANSK